VQEWLESLGMRSVTVDRNQTLTVTDFYAAYSKPVISSSAENSSAPEFTVAYCEEVLANVTRILLNKYPTNCSEEEEVESDSSNNDDTQTTVESARTTDLSTIAPLINALKNGTVNSGQRNKTKKMKKCDKWGKKPWRRFEEDDYYDKNDKSKKKYKSKQPGYGKKKPISGSSEKPFDINWYELTEDPVLVKLKRVKICEKVLEKAKKENRTKNAGEDDDDDDGEDRKKGGGGYKKYEKRVGYEDDKKGGKGKKYLLGCKDEKTAGCRKDADVELDSLSGEKEEVEPTRQEEEGSEDSNNEEEERNSGDAEESVSTTNSEKSEEDSSGKKKEEDDDDDDDEEDRKKEKKKQQRENNNRRPGENNRREERQRQQSGDGRKPRQVPMEDAEDEESDDPVAPQMRMVHRFQRNMLRRRAPLPPHRNPEEEGGDNNGGSDLFPQPPPNTHPRFFPPKAGAASKK